MSALLIFTHLLSLIVPPMAYTLSRSFGLPVLWSLESVFTFPSTQAVARESPKFAHKISPCFIIITVAVEPVNSVAEP